MLSEKFFTPSETARIEASQKKFKRIVFLLLFVLAPAQVLIAYAASQKVPALFWPISLFGLALLGVSYYFVFLKGLRSLKQELSEQVKLVGELQVISKKKYKEQRIIGFDSTEVETILVPFVAYEMINIGDVLTIEVAKHTKSLFKLSKDGQDLLGGG